MLCSFDGWKSVQNVINQNRIADAMMLPGSCAVEDRVALWPDNFTARTRVRPSPDWTASAVRVQLRKVIKLGYSKARQLPLHSVQHFVGVMMNFLFLVNAFRTWDSPLLDADDLFCDLLLPFFVVAQTDRHRQGAFVA